MTIVEGVVGALILTLGALGALQVFDAGTRNTYRAEESQTLNNRLQAELEEIRSLPYNEIALTGLPPGSGDSNNPRWRVSGSRYALNRGGSGLAQMVYDGGEVPGGGTVEGGLVTPGPEPYTVGDVSGRIYRFIAWTGDPNCAECGAGLVKRIVVAATVDEAPVSFERTFQEIQANVVDPEASLDDNPAPYEDEIDASGLQLYLSDVPCDGSEAEVASAGHDTHNTLGRCGDGAQTESQPGAPDLMASEPFYGVEGEEEAEDPPPVDYAEDVESTGGGAEIGLAMLLPSKDTCLTESALGVENARKLAEGQSPSLPEAPGELDGLLQLQEEPTNPHLRRHAWLSGPVTSGSGGELSGSATLVLFTQTVNGAVYPGKICITLFVRRTVDLPGEAGGSIEVDLPVVDVGPGTQEEGIDCEPGTGQPYFRCQKASWPTSWKSVPFRMDFSAVDGSGSKTPVVLAPGDRVGVALAIKPGGTDPGQGLEFMYGAPEFESRLELEADQVIGFD